MKTFHNLFYSYRIEPSKEMKAALKVLNDNLIKPERSNKSAIVSVLFSFS